MNSKILCIIASLILILAFFMPWLKFFGIGGTPFDILLEITKNFKYLDHEPSLLLSYLMLVFPFSGLLILILYLQPNINKDAIFILDTLKKAPLVFLILGIFFGLLKLGDSAKMLFDSNLLEILGTGFYLTSISALILFFNSTKADMITNTKNTDSIKEKANTNDLFN